MRGNIQLIEKLQGCPSWRTTPEWRKLENEMNADTTITFSPFRCRLWTILEFQRKDRVRPTRAYAEINIYEDNVTMKLSHNKPEILTHEGVNEINKWQLNALDVCIKNNLIIVD